MALTLDTVGVWIPYWILTWLDFVQGPYFYLTTMSNMLNL